MEFKVNKYYLGKDRKEILLFKVIKIDLNDVVPTNGHAIHVVWYCDNIYIRNGISIFYSESILANQKWEEIPEKVVKVLW